MHIMKNNSNKIQSLAHRLGNIDRDLIKAKQLNKLPFATLKIYNASNKQEEINISNNLKGELKNFLTNYFNKEKKKIFKEIKKLTE